MKKIAMVALVIAPTLAHAQSGVTATSQTTATGTASTSRGNTSVNGSASVHAKADAKVSAARAEHAANRGAILSAEAQAKVDADLRTARERRLPEEPIRRRVAEGEAKGAADARIVAASGETLAQLEASSDAMVRGGRRDPSDAEVARGAQLIARGYTSAQIEAVARRAPSDRSLVVAFETLASLRARGASTDRAVAQVQSRLAARASDAEIRQLGIDANAAAQVDGSVGRGGMGQAGAAGSVTGNAAGSVGGVAGSAAAGAGTAAGSTIGRGTTGVTGGATGTIGGALSRP